MKPLEIRIQGGAGLPTLVYLPGIHGDWTLVSSFRSAVAGRVRFVEFAYSHSTTASLADYISEIGQALITNGVSSGWLIGESFGSQPAWGLIERAAATPKGASVFRPEGLILAGGFVRHPSIPAVRMAQRASARVTRPALSAFLGVYSGYARFRHRVAPETLASVEEFVANRLVEEDRHALTHRYGLIARNDPRPIARATTIPVHDLAGFVDPLVPWPLVRAWLRRHCPGYRGGRTLARADHNVLGTAPVQSARMVLGWIGLPAEVAVRRPGKPVRPVR